MSWLDANAEGLGLLLIFGLLGIAALLIAMAVERRMEPRSRITRIDPRCERVGSQAEFNRRLRAGGSR